MKQKYERFSTEDLKLIRKLTDEGKSLKYLSDLFNVRKNSIYYQVRKFKPRIKKDFVANLSDFQIGELIGAFAGDGNYYHQPYNKDFPHRSTHHRIRYSLTYSKEKDYAEYLKNLLFKTNLNPHIINRNNSDLILTVNSKEYINFIKTYLIWDKDKTLTIKLKNKISENSEDFLKGFARGLMDTDGFLNSSNVICACISKELINNLSDIFVKFGLNITRTSLNRGGNTRELYFVRVRSASLNEYANLIGFSGQNKLNSLKLILQKRISKD
jgi:hypothetical protein